MQIDLFLRANVPRLRNVSGTASVLSSEFAMKTPSLLLLSAVFLAGSFLSLRAEDWKTNDGKVYQDVKVVRSEPDAVTILHHDGGGRIPLANLPPDLQKRFHYDPAKAKAAADARARDDAENGKGANSVDVGAVRSLGDSIARPAQ